MRTPRPFDAHRCPWRPTPVPSTLTHGLDPHLLSATRRSARAHAASLARASGSRALDPTRRSAHCRRASDLAGSQLPARSRMGAGMRARQRRRRPRGRLARTAHRHAPRRPRAGRLHAGAANGLMRGSQEAASEMASAVRLSTSAATVSAGEPLNTVRRSAGRASLMMSIDPHRPRSADRARHARRRARPTRS